MNQKISGKDVPRETFLDKSSSQGCEDVICSGISFVVENDEAGVAKPIMADLCNEQNEANEEELMTKIVAAKVGDNSDADYIPSGKKNESFFNDSNYQLSEEEVKFRDIVEPHFWMNLTTLLKRKQKGLMCPCAMKVNFMY